MERIMNDQHLEHQLSILASTREKHSSSDKIKLTPDLVDALMAASQAYGQIKGFTKDRFEAIKQILGREGNIIDSNIPSYGKFMFADFYKDTIKDKDSVPYDIVKCSTRVLQNYMVLIKQEEQLAEFRKLKTLDELFRGTD